MILICLQFTKILFLFFISLFYNKVEEFRNYFKIKVIFTELVWFKFEFLLVIITHDLTNHKLLPTH